MQEENNEEFSLEEIAQAAELYPSLWVEKHGIKNENGLPIEFNDHNFMRDLYDDMSPLQAWLKSPQVGATTAQIVKTFYIADKKGKQIIYTLPTDGDIKDMAGGKVNRIVAQNPDIGAMVKDHDSVEQKSVGKSIIYYRGTWTQKAAMMVSSDLNVHDEVDASNAEVIVQYENRLLANPNGMRWYFSHPSLQGHGVDVYWQQSDKKEWVISCNCGKRQILTWPESIDIERAVYQCKFCKKELNNDVRRNGLWLPTSTGEFSGYHISQMMCPWITAQAIIDSFNDPKKNEQYFYNYVLGLPYVGSENKISSSVVLKNVTPEINEQKDRIIIGVDPGLPMYFTCMNKQGAFYYGSCSMNDEHGKPQDPWDDIRKLLNRWPTSIVVVDGNADNSMQRRLQAQYVGRVFLCFYRKDRKSKDMTDWGENNEQGTVRVDRNQYFQWMVEQLRDTGRIRLNGKPEEWTDWASHFDNVYREIKVALNKPGKDVATNYGAELIWKRNGADHFCHTLLYCLVGLEKYGSEGATFLKRDNFTRFPTASRINNSIPARRILGKKGYDIAQFD